ncbi:MrpF/PhaF family protein [Streptomyces sp. NPDC059629]|uniref:MrpF/PhaF family protein n=1 Tax=Streptomyces sp. NPDC059629 TaxID=3346889 RepID=UPI0036AD2E9D
MNAWLLATAILLTLGVPPCVWAAGRGTAVERLAGLSLATTVVTAVLLLTAQGFARGSFTDLGLVLAVLGPAGTLVFARLLGGRSIDTPGARENHGDT